MSILLVDDNPHIADSIRVAVRLAGHTLDHADGPEQALSRLAARRYDAILLDLNYAPGRTGGEEGLMLLSRIVAGDAAARVVVITAHSGVRIAVEAMRAGARDFVMKPWRNADLIAKVEAAAARPTARVAPALREPESAILRLLGESKGIGQVRDLVRRVGPTIAGVLVTGASGSGRNLVAALIHAASAWADERITRVDLRDRRAWQAIGACRGTLLLQYPDRLDEVDQARLLHELPDAVRCIAIADDPRAVGPALARRIAAVEIAVPRLADRDGDALLLARHFVRLAAERHGRPVPCLTPDAEAAVLSTRWPDEVRGLAAAVERAVLLGDGDTVAASLLCPPCPAPALAPTLAQDVPASRFDLEGNERAVIEAALREHRHNVTHAATALGLSRGALYRRMSRHGL